MTDVTGWRQADYLPPFNAEFRIREFYISTANMIKYFGVLIQGTLAVLHIKSQSSPDFFYSY
jgi:hypothetical protein